MNKFLPTHERLEAIERAIESHGRELEDHDARFEELELREGLLDDEVEQDDFPDPDDDIEQIGTRNGAELWDVSEPNEELFLITSARLRAGDEIEGVWVTPETLAELATIAEERGGD